MKVHPIVAALFAATAALSAADDTPSSDLRERSGQQDVRSLAENSPPDAVFATTPVAGEDGTIRGGSPLEVTFNMCRSTDPDVGDELKFTYDFDGDGSVDEIGHCRGTAVYAPESGDGCLWQPSVCVSDRNLIDGHQVCATYKVCVSGTSSPTPGGGFLYNNGNPDLASGNEMTAWIQADDFTPTVAGTVCSVRFWSLEGPASYQGSIEWEIRDDAAGFPGTVVTSGTAAPSRAATGRSAFGFDEYVYDVPVTCTPVLAGTTYWLSLHNGAFGFTTDSDFYWGSAPFNSTINGREDDDPFDGSWAGNGQEHAFRLQ